MTEALRATSAAPTYFPEVKLKTNKNKLLLVDGGLGANCPAAIGNSPCSTSLLEIGCPTRSSLACGVNASPGGDTQFCINPKHFGWLSCRTPVTAGVMKTQSEVTFWVLSKNQNCMASRRRLLPILCCFSALRVLNDHWNGHMLKAPDPRKELLQPRTCELLIALGTGVLPGEKSASWCEYSLHCVLEQTPFCVRTLQRATVSQRMFDKSLNLPKIALFFSHGA